MRRRVSRWCAALGVLGLVVLAGPAQAWAGEPAPLLRPGRVTDRAGALQGRTAQAGAAVGAAAGYEAELDGHGRPVSAAPATYDGPGGAALGTGVGVGTSNGAADLWIPVVVVAAAGLVALMAVRRRRRTAAAGHGPPVASGGQPGARRVRRYAPRLTPLPELAAQAGQLLVATDDAVRTSREDVGLAAAQCGARAARPFTEAVDYAAGELAAAFRLRQRLDDDEAADDDTRRQLLDEILSRCTQADRRLDAESEAFDRLRAMEANAPRALAEAELTAAALPGRIAAAAAELAPLPARYTGSALDPVAGHPARARDRLDFARGSLDQARAALGTDHGRAAVFIRAAEGALVQATALADAAARRVAELHTADRWLRETVPAAVASSADGDPAPTAGPGDARLGAVLADVRGRVGSGRYDPLAEVWRVAEAGAELERAGEPRGRALLELALLPARSEVAAARDLVTTHRGAIGVRARTRLAAAERKLAGAEAESQAEAPAEATATAQAAARGEPAAVLALARDADRLARAAQDLARQDIGGYVPGGFGRTRGMPGVEGLGAAMLGGIVIGELSGGSRGGFGGMSGGVGGSGPASFGGTDTRGRMGGGGRF
ncbi:TPM domain-containing protein [Actinacidiphila epipremni]|uniref:TPM domain-containing protein n=1 Tax=Actinacidiphila epipremni TaxID=2053013 RepID=A0ABX0ZI71_9ACTN|nr:TPM domain-containing protein [Actinacidiphila epipremni]NJP42502.1 TPM domain-containing protein [Actinacidiphila epipremni]